MKNNNNNILNSKIELKNTNLYINMEKKKKKNKRKKSNYNLRDSGCSGNYKNFELNSFNYKMALNYDKRAFCQYYFSLYITKNIVLFAFYPNDDYNLKIVKINIFFLSFDIYFLMNTLFFKIEQL